MNPKAVRVVVAVVTAVIASALMQNLISSMNLNQWVVAILTIAVPVIFGGFVAGFVTKGER